ncbi:MAG TPA: ABC transporter permease [Clostridia bacterium]|nr:ABC transporter permease [Clostridia bacterium]
MFGESVRMSWSNIVHSKMRSFLTILGIIIGVTAIITLITVVQGATYEVTSQFTALGTGKITINAAGTALKRGKNETDLADLAALDNVGGISPTVSFSTNVASEYAWADKVAIQGKNEVYFRYTEDLVARGRGLNVLDVEARNTVCLINKPLMETLFFGKDPLGRTVTVNGMAYTICGVLSDADGDSLMSQALGRSSKKGKLIIPYTSALRMTGAHLVSSLEVLVADTGQTDQVIADCERVLNAAFNYKDDSYSVINMESLLETMNTMLGMMTSMLAGIASIALVVGGIGIMNMMLVSVSERKAEIGLRKALGAQPGQIQLQFLIESFLLSVLGGVIGLATGVLLSMLLCSVMGIAFHFSAPAAALGFGFSAAVGILFGWTPARKASKLNPIDALRSV